MTSNLVRTRIGTIALGACLAGAALAGCTAAGSTNAGGFGGGGAGSALPGPPLTLPAIPPTSAPATTAAPVQPPAAPVAVTTTNAPRPPAPPTPPAPPIVPTPTASLCPSKFFRFVHISAVGVDPATSRDDFTGELAEIECGPGVPDDQQYITVGPPVVYDLSPGGATIDLVSNDGQGEPVTWDQFIQSDIGEYGGYYGFNVDNTGLVTELDESFHP